MPRPVPEYVNHGYRLRLYNGQWVNTKLVSIGDYTRALAIGLETLVKDGELDIATIKCNEPK